MRRPIEIRDLHIWFGATEGFGRSHGARGDSPGCVPGFTLDYFRASLRDGSVEAFQDGEDEKQVLHFAPKSHQRGPRRSLAIPEGV